MTDAALATATVTVNEIERQVRARLVESQGDERQAAQAAMRQAVALRRALEAWIVQRATTGARR